MVEENNDKNFKGIEQLYVWNKRVLEFGGMWPLEKSFFKFYIGALYLGVHLTLALSDLVSVFGDMSLTLENLIETPTQIMIAMKMIAIRYSTQLVGVLQQVRLGLNEDRYMDREEKKLYFSYNATGRFFFRTSTYFTLVALLMFFLKPLEDMFKAVLRNETVAFVLPCRMSLFYEITDWRIYVLLYLSQCPMIYYYYFHTASTCLICTLIVHVAGDLSILAHRIRHVNAPEASRGYDDPDVAFANVLVEHHKIVSTAKAINDIFNIIVLIELSVSTILIGLTCYNVLGKSLKVSMVDFLFVINDSAIVLVLIFVYCIIGDFLIRESMNVHDAFYECRWYEMELKYQKNLIICMAGARKPLQLTAGRFYTFSLPQFCGILKTSGAYISMLRTIV